MFRPNLTVGYHGYKLDKLPDIKAFFTPDIISCHFLVYTCRFFSGNSLVRLGMIKFSLKNLFG